MAPALPDDVLIQVMLEVDYESIISLRQTSRHMNALTHTHAIWATLLFDSEEENRNYTPKIFYLERSLDTYDADELEALYVQRLRDKDPWVTKGLTKRKEPLNLTWSGAQSAMILVPGGRWLLIPEDPRSTQPKVPSFFTNDMRSERIWYYDLDSSQHSPTRSIARAPLFGDQSYDLHTMTFSGVRIDTTAPTLTFTFAQLYREQTGDNVDLGNAPWILHIWRVKLVHNDVFKYDSLSAECLKTLDLGEMDGDHSTVTMHLFEGSLHDDKVAFSFRVNDEASVVIVLDWMEAVDGACEFKAIGIPRIGEPYQPDVVNLLPNSTILFIAKGGYVTTMKVDSDVLAPMTYPVLEPALSNMVPDLGIGINEILLGTLRGVHPSEWARKKTYSPLKFGHYKGEDIARISYIDTETYQMYTAEIRYTGTESVDNDESSERYVYIGMEPFDLSRHATIRDPEKGIVPVQEKADYDSIVLTPEYGIVVRGRLIHLLWNMTTMHGQRAARMIIGYTDLFEAMAMDRASGRIVVRDKGDLLVVYPEYVALDPALVNPTEIPPADPYAP